MPGALVSGEGQDALGAVDSVVVPDGLLMSVDGAVLGRVVVEPAGADVPDGLLHAATAPPRETARARASRIRLAMVGDPPLQGRRAFGTSVA
jgi:hypothetical protein